MKSDAESWGEYVAQLPDHRIEAFLALGQKIRESLPQGFEECFSYGMPAFAVPHSLYPAGYHCNPAEPLPFISLGNQKGYIALYHMGLYVFPDIAEWFEREYRQLKIGKPDLGKSCIRFKNMDKIPYHLVGELCGKITVEQWIDAYEQFVRP